MTERKITMRRVLRAPPTPKEKPLTVGGIPVDEVEQAIALLTRAFGDNLRQTTLAEMASFVWTAKLNHERAQQAPVNQVPRQANPRNPIMRVRVTPEAMQPAFTDPDEEQQRTVRQRDPQPFMFIRIIGGVNEMDWTGYERALHEYAQQGRWDTQPWEAVPRSFAGGVRVGDVEEINYDRPGPDANNGAQTYMASVAVRRSGPRVVIPIQPHAFTHSNCIHVFKDDSCGYTGDISSCNRQFDSCFLCRNTQNFSGSRIARHER